MSNYTAINELKAQMPEHDDVWWNTPEQHDESAKYLIDVFEYLEQCASDASKVYDKVYDFDELSELAPDDDWKGDNTYNWNACITHDLDIRYANLDDGTVLIALRVHRAGDVRCNYTDFVVMQFDSLESWYECEFNLDNTFTLEVDGDIYYITPRLSELYDVYAEDGDSTELYIDDLTDKAAAKAIREWRDK